MSNTANGVADTVLPPPRIIRGGQQVIPPLRERTYTDQLEFELDTALSCQRALAVRVTDLEQRLRESEQRAAQPRSRGGKASRVRRSTQSSAQHNARRRARRAAAAGECLDLGQGVVFDLDGWRLRSATGGMTEISSNEGLMLRALLGQLGRVVLYSQIARAIWQGDPEPAGENHGVTVVVSHLRTKLRAAGCDGLITTIPGVGLRLEMAQCQKS